MVFPWSLNDSKSSQVFRTLLSILPDLDKAIVWMASCSLISKSSSTFTKALGIAPTSPSTIGISVIPMSYCSF